MLAENTKRARRVPIIDVKKDWGFKVKGSCSTPTEARKYVKNALCWLCKKHDIDQSELFNSKSNKSVMVRSLWYFVALEALRPWMDKIEIARFVGCPHSSFYYGWKRQEKINKQ